MDFQRDVFSEEAITNIYNGIEQDIPEYVYHHSIYTEIVLKMILEIRDIQNGYGQQEKAYDLLRKWISQCPLNFQQMVEDQAIRVLEKMCVQYGCWKDIKNICLLLSNEDRHQYFVKRALQLMNDNLYSDQLNVAKWIPREGSIHGQTFYNYLATDYVERFLQLETATPVYPILHGTTTSIEQIRKIYKNVVKNKQQSKFSLPKKQKTKKTIQEAETALIEKALFLSKQPSSTVDINEEDAIEKEWLNAIENYETIDNSILILDTPLTFLKTQENMNRIKTVCRFLYKISLPSRKRLLITTCPEPFWINVMGKTLVETIRTIVQYTEVNDNPTEKSRTICIKYLLESLKICEIPMEETEKMTWIILSNFSQQPFSVVHSSMTNLFLSYSVMLQYIPNLIYVKTPSQKDPLPPPFPPYPSCLYSLAIRTFWTECFQNIGISNNHWKQIAKITKDPYIRQFTPFQNAVNIVSSNTPLL